MSAQAKNKIERFTNLFTYSRQIFPKIMRIIHGCAPKIIVYTRLSRCTTAIIRIPSIAAAHLLLSLPHFPTTLPWLIG
jgi:hypothetical protein